MRVDQIMTRDVATVGMDAMLAEVQDRIKEAGIHHLVVVDDLRVVGVISERDLLRHVSPFIGADFMERGQDLNTLRKKAHQVMSRRPQTIHPGASVIEAASMMLQKRISSLPVLDSGGNLCGIVSIWDVMAAVAGVQAPVGPLRHDEAESGNTVSTPHEVF